MRYGGSIDGYRRCVSVRIFVYPSRCILRLLRRDVGAAAERAERNRNTVRLAGGRHHVRSGTRDDAVLLPAPADRLVVPDSPSDGGGIGTAVGEIQYRQAADEQFHRLGNAGKRHLLGLALLHALRHDGARMGAVDAADALPCELLSAECGDSVFLVQVPRLRLERAYGTIYFLPISVLFFVESSSVVMATLVIVTS